MGAIQPTRSVRHEAVKPCRMGATVNFYGLIARASLSIEAKIKDPTEKKTWRKSYVYRSNWSGVESKEGVCASRALVSFGLIQCRRYIYVIFFCRLALIYSTSAVFPSTSWQAMSLVHYVWCSAHGNGITRSAAGH